jgi:hypothetical protein
MSKHQENRYAAIKCASYCFDKPLTLKLNSEDEMTNKPGQAIIETTQIGMILRVTAIDATTGTEVVFQAPINTPRSSLEQTAMNKLRYVLNKKA